MSLAVTAGPAAARPAHAQAGKTITLHFYSVVTGLTYTRPDGTVAAHPPQKPEAGGKLDISELAYKGTHQSHAKKWTLTSHTTCVFSAKGAPTCDGQTAIGGNQMLFFHTPAGQRSGRQRRHRPLRRSDRDGRHEADRQHQQLRRRGGRAPA